MVLENTLLLWLLEYSTLDFTLLINARNANQLKNVALESWDFPNNSNYDFKISNGKSNLKIWNFTLTK